MNRFAGHVVLFGLGTVGAEVLVHLVAAGLRVIAVDRTPNERARAIAATSNTQLLIGNVTAPDVFEALNITTARAFISCTSDDKVNLETALRINDAAPGLRTVVRLNNDNLARQLEARFPSWTVLGIPALASPAFVAAALAPESFRSWRIDREILSYVEIPVDQPCLLREISADLTPLYVRRESGEFEHWPAPPAPLQRGDRLGAVVDLIRLFELGRATGDDIDIAQVAPGPILRFTGRIGGIVVDADRRLLTALAIALMLGSIAVMVFMHFKDLSLVSAIYFTVTTMATVGYGDINLLEDSPPLKMFGVVVMLTSLLVVSILTAFVTNWVLSARLSRLFGSQRSHAFDHVVVCGLGSVGFRIVEEIRAVALETVGLDAGGTEGFSNQALQSGAVVINGDARQAETLRRANIEGARSIVVTTSDDLTNLEIAMRAREANPRIRIVVRLIDEEFASRVRGTFDVEHVLSPASLAASAFAAAAVGRSIADRFTVGTQEYLYAHFLINPGSTWEGATIGDVLRGREAVIIAYIPAIGVTRVRPSTRLPLRSGDVLMLICAPEAWDEISSERVESLATLG